MLPYSFNGPVYHWPIATVGLIVANVLVFIGAASGNIHLENGWILQYGNGLHAQQWVLSLFAHASFEHLLSNMFFLWVFGLVIEGKIGWLKFLACYFLIGAGQSAIEQCVFATGAYAGEGSMGASGAVFGLMAMACVWAPANEVSLFMWFMLRAFTFDVQIGVFAAIYVGIELTQLLLFGPGALSALLHLMGAVLGAAIGSAMLFYKQVDCEHWDLFSMFRGDYGPYAKKLEGPKLSDAELKEKQQTQSVDAKRRFVACLQANQPLKALETRQKMIDLGRPLELDRKEILALIVSLQKSQKWKESAPVMVELLRRFPQGSEPVRLKLAQVCLVELEKPCKAIELLEALPSDNLSDEQRKLRQKLLLVARKQVEEGALEVDDGAL